MKGLKVNFTSDGKKMPLSEKKKIVVYSDKSY